MEGDAEFGFAFVPDLDGGSVLAEVCAFEGYKEGVEVLLHRKVDLRFEISDLKFKGAGRCGVPIRGGRGGWVAFWRSFLAPWRRNFLLPFYWLLPCPSPPWIFR